MGRWGECLRTGKRQSVHCCGDQWARSVFLKKRRSESAMRHHDAPFLRARQRHARAECCVHHRSCVTERTLHQGGSTDETLPSPHSTPPRLLPPQTSFRVPFSLHSAPPLPHLPPPPLRPRFSSHFFPTPPTPVTPKVPTPSISRQPHSVPVRA